MVQRIKTKQGKIETTENKTKQKKENEQFIKQPVVQFYKNDEVTNTDKNTVKESTTRDECK